MEHHWQIVDSGKITVGSTAQEIWDAAREYFKWCDDHPLQPKRMVLSGKLAGAKFKDEIIRPYSMQAMCLHCGITEEYVADMLSTKKSDSDYYMVFSRIDSIIRIQNLELATIGVYNPGIIAKLLNIEEAGKVDTPTTIEIVGNVPELSNSEMEIIEKMNSELQLARNKVA